MSTKLATTYLGLKLDHPIVASSSPLSREFDGIRQLEDAGAAAVVMPSIYEEEVVAEDIAYTELVEQGSWTQPEAAGGYFPELTAYRVGSLEARVETLRRAVDSCSIPIIASLNGSTPEGWTTFAHDLEQAGAAGKALGHGAIVAGGNAQRGKRGAQGRFGGGDERPHEGQVAALDAGAFGQPVKVVAHFAAFLLFRMIVSPASMIRVRPSS